MRDINPHLAFFGELFDQSEEAPAIRKTVEAMVRLARGEEEGKDVKE
jgi:hypothetical protein